jgi:hypothetical protein
MKTLSKRWYYGQQAELVSESGQLREVLTHPATGERWDRPCDEKLLNLYIDMEVKRKEIKQRNETGDNRQQVI